MVVTKQQYTYLNYNS